MNIEQYEKKYSRDFDNNFAVACYNDNSIEELQEPHRPEDADPIDCQTWGISTEEWSDAIQAALNERMVDLD